MVAKRAKAEINSVAPGEASTINHFYKRRLVQFPCAILT